MLANNENLTISERMRVLRIRLGLTQDQLTNHFGTTKYAYRKIETGDMTRVSDDLLSDVQAFVAENWTRDATPYELLRIERERASYTTTYTAGVVGFSRSLYMIVEGGGRPQQYAPEFQQAINNHATERKATAG